MSEPEPNPDARLDAIETQWSLVRRAHRRGTVTGTLGGGADARSALVMRYSPAIHRYIRAMTKNETEAEDLSQEVIVRILRGDFAGADPDRGRFRDLLKTAVRNMVKNFWEKSNRRRPVEHDLDAVVDDSDSETEPDPWETGWRNNILELTWASLKTYETETPGSIAHTVLRIRSEYPAAKSDEIAERLSEATGRPMTAATARQQLRRARLRFAEFLVEEVAQGLDNPTRERVRDELVDLGLYEHIRDVLPPEWNEAKPTDG